MTDSNRNDPPLASIIPTEEQQAQLLEIMKKFNSATLPNLGFQNQFNARAAKVAQQLAEENKINKAKLAQCQIIADELTEFTHSFQFSELGQDQNDRNFIGYFTPQTNHIQKGFLFGTMREYLDDSLLSPQRTDPRKEITVIIDADNGISVIPKDLSYDEAQQKFLGTVHTTDINVAKKAFSDWVERVAPHMMVKLNIKQGKADPCGLALKKPLRIKTTPLIGK